MLLAGDVGGTKVRLALFSPGRHDTVQEKRYWAKDFPDLSTLMRAFLKEMGSPPIRSACIGVAGAVVNGRGKETNISWVIDAEKLKEELGLPKMWVINDLEAHAWGLGVLKKEELVCLQPGVKVQGNQALIAAGTGLGEAGLYWDGRQHLPFACEGGHVDYAPTNEEELALWHFFRGMYEHVSYERILCGTGIYELYRFLVVTGREMADPEIEKLSAADAPQKRITEKAMQGDSRVCVHALDLFVSIYGAECGNTALKFLSLGGIFIGGGIVPHIVPFFTKKNFISPFRDKGRFAGLLDKIPVHIVLNERTALLGAARYAQERE